MPHGFDSVSSLIDEWYRIDENDDQRFFENLLSDLKNDPNGPRVDLRADIVALLESDVVVLSGLSPAEGETDQDREGMIFAIKTGDEASLKRAVQKLEESDPNARTARHRRRPGMGNQTAGNESLGPTHAPRAATATHARDGTGH